jgi:hypothetical protein
VICYYSDNSYVIAFNISNLIVSCILPFGILMVTTLFTVRALYKSKNRLAASLTSGSENAQAKKNRKYAINSIVYNIVFTVLKLPIILSFFWSLSDYVSQNYFYSIASTLSHFSFCIGFFVNVATNSIFRKEIIFILKIKKSNSSTIATMTQKRNTISNTH